AAEANQRHRYDVVAVVARDVELPRVLRLRWWSEGHTDVRGSARFEHAGGPAWQKREGRRGPRVGQRYGRYGDALVAYVLQMQRQRYRIATLHEPEVERLGRDL